MASKQMEEFLKEANSILKVQGNDGNWDYDEYMFGMFNGMELIVSMAEKREPNFRKAPKKWKRKGFFKRLFWKSSPIGASANGTQKK
jgi:hypothetical protein